MTSYRIVPRQLRSTAPLYRSYTSVLGFGSVMPYGLDEQGRPIFLIGTMAMHTQNLQADSRASLLVTQPDGSGDPLGASRVTVMGHVLTIPGPEVAEARRLYLEHYANSKYWVDWWTLKIFPFTAWMWWTFISWAASV
jgi:putative heme iron utilization protein